jgi:cytochrome b
VILVPLFFLSFSGQSSGCKLILQCHRSSIPVDPQDPFCRCCRGPDLAAACILSSAILAFAVKLSTARRIDNVPGKLVGQPAERMNNASRLVHVWDAPTRLFHWLVVVLVAAAYATWRANWMIWHGRIGDVLLTLLLFRLLWGFFGSEPARFSRFLTSPRKAKQYLLHALRREPDRQAGHNPAGGWMVLLLLFLLLAETLTGLYVANDIADVGPFTEISPASVADAIAALHAMFWDALLGAIALHLLTIFVYAAAKGQNLLLPMITGTKFLPTNVPPPRIASLTRAAFLIAGSAVAAALLVNLL